MFQVCGVFAEFERGMICERVNAGPARPGRRARELGGVRIKPSVEERIRELRAEGMGISERSSRTVEVGAFVVQRLAEDSELRHEQGDRLPIYGPGRQTHRTAEGPPLERSRSYRIGKARQILEDSAALVDAMVLNVGGFTELDFDPRSEWAGLAGRPAKLNASSSKPRTAISAQNSTTVKTTKQRSKKSI